MYNYGFCDYDYYNISYYQQLTEDLEEYIQDELQDSAFYQELARLAPTALSKQIILEFSSDEKMHAKNFQETYRMLTGKYYTPKPLEPISIKNYESALKQRILAETKDYKKYGEQYLKAPTKYLQDLFFMTRTIEAQHAMRIPILFEEEKKE